MSANRGKRLALLCLLPFALFFFAFQIAPLLWVAVNSLRREDAWGLGNFAEIFASPFYLQAIRYSLEISLWSSLIGLAIAVLGSYSLRQVDSRLRDFVMAFANMTSNFAGVPLAFAFIIILGFNGAITLLLKQAGLIEDFNLYSKTGLIILANALGAYATVYSLTTGNFNVVPIRIAGLVSGDVFLDPNMASALAMILVGLMTVITLAHQWLLRRSYHVEKR